MKLILFVACFILLLIGCGAKTVEELPVEVQSSIMHRDGSVVLCMADGFEIQLLGIKVSEYDNDKASEYRAMSRCVLHSLVTRKQIRLECDAVKIDTAPLRGTYMPVICLSMLR